MPSANVSRKYPCHCKKMHQAPIVMFTFIYFYHVVFFNYKLIMQFKKMTSQHQWKRFPFEKKVIVNLQPRSIRLLYYATNWMKFRGEFICVAMKKQNKCLIQTWWKVQKILHIFSSTSLWNSQLQKSNLRKTWIYVFSFQGLKENTVWGRIAKRWHVHQLCNQEVD